MTTINNRVNNYNTSEVKPLVRTSSISTNKTLDNKTEVTSPNETYNITSGNGLSSKEISFVDSPSLNLSIKDATKQLENQVNKIIQNQNLSPDDNKKLKERLSSLTNFLNSNTLDNNEQINNLNNKINDLVIQLKVSGINTNVLNNSLNDLITSITTQVSDKNKLNLSVISKKDNLLGIQNNSTNLTDKQKEIVNSLKNTVQNTESLKSKNSGKISQNDLILMSVRDELLRQSFERLNFRTEKPLEVIEKDLEIISNLVSSVDQMMSKSKDLPPNMLEGLSNMTKSISDAPIGDMDKALQNFSNTLSNTNFKVPDTNGLNKLPDTKTFQQLNKQLVSLTQYAPTGVADGVKSVIQSYSKAMNNVEKMLPPILPFPVTMPIPLGYNDGSGNSFLLGSGSKLSQSGSGFQINAPSMFLQNGSTQVSAGQTNVQLGNSLDYISTGNLNIKTNDTNTSLTNATAQIDRATGSSMIRADKAVVNMTDGKVELTNAGLYQGSDGSLKLGADSIWQENSNGHLGLKNFQAIQTENNKTSNFSISGEKLDLKKSDTLVTADKMSFNLEKNKETNSSQALLTGENIKVLTGGNEISAQEAQVKLLQNSDGSNLTQINAKNPNINLSNGSNLSVNGNTSLSIEQNANGDMKKISAQAEQINFKDKTNQLKVDQGNLNLNYDESGKLKDISANANSIDFKNKDSQITGDKINIIANYKDDKIESISGTVNKLNYESKQGKLDVTSGNVNAEFNKNGLISNISGKADNILYKNSQGNLNVSQANVTGSFNEDGTLSSIKGGADKLSYLSNKGDKIDIKGAEVELINGKNGLEKASLTVGELNYISKTGELLNITNGKASLTRDNQGFISNISGEADKLNYNSKNGDNINASGLQININGNKTGLTDASIKVGTIDYTNQKGDKLNVINGSASIVKDNNGLISKVNASAEQINAVNKAGDVIKVTGFNSDITKNVSGTYDINASADNINANLKNQNLTIDANKLNLGITDNQIKLHVDSAEVIKKIESDLKVKVENLDVIVDKTKEGNLKALDLQLQNLDASVKGMNLMVKTESGDRLRLNMSVSDDGKVLKEAFLQIPKGGEVKIEKDDLKIALGEQTIKFSQNNGIYTLRDDGLNIAAQFKDGQVKVQGGSAQLSMDTNTGNLLIDEIKGTKINAEFGKNKIDLDIKEISNFMVKTSGLSGDVKGLSFELVPTKDSSKITLAMKADIGGIPVKVKLDDVHHLKASGSIGMNQAHVYFGDVSGRGKVSISSGPLKIEGSAIEFLAKYNTYNPERMMSSVSRYMSNEGLKLGSLTLEADGVIRLEKQSSGLHIGGALMLPRVWEEKAYDLVGIPNQREKDGTWGIVGSIGGQGRSNDGTKYTGALYGGLVPGSYFSVKQIQGTTSIYNVPLPKNIEIPTTVMAGLMFRRENEHSRLGATVGAYVNPVGLIPESPSIPLQDKTMYGAFAGVSYKTGNLQFNLDALADVNKNPDTGKTQIAPMVRTGVSFQF